MDIQRDIVGLADDGPDICRACARLSTVLARRAIPVIYVAIGLRPGHPGPR
jgi:hypothetical protein